MLPGGVANPDILRTIPEAVEFTRAFFEAGKPVAAICHGPWTLVEAGVVDGRTSKTNWNPVDEEEDRHELPVRPSTTPASTSVHGPWQIAATGLPASKNALVNSTASGTVRRMSGLATPPGRTSPS